MLGQAAGTAPPRQAGREARSRSPRPSRPKPSSCTPPDRSPMRRRPTSRAPISPRPSTSTRYDAPRSHPMMRPSLTGRIGSQAIDNQCRARPQRLARRDLQHHHHPRCRRESLPERLDCRSRLHRDMQPLDEAVQVEPGQRDGRTRIWRPEPVR